MFPSISLFFFSREFYLFRGYRVLGYISGRVFSPENTVKTIQQQPTNLNLYQSSYIGVFVGKHPTVAIFIF